MVALAERMAADTQKSAAVFGGRTSEFAQITHWLKGESASW